MSDYLLCTNLRKARQNHILAFLLGIAIIKNIEHRACTGSCHIIQQPGFLIRKMVYINHNYNFRFQTFETGNCRKSHIVLFGFPQWPCCLQCSKVFIQSCETQSIVGICQCVPGKNYKITANSTAVLNIPDNSINLLPFILSAVIAVILNLGSGYCGFSLVGNVGHQNIGICNLLGISAIRM